MDVRTANLSYLWFTYALQQANNPSDQLPDDWYWQVQVETHILKQALATCNSYGTIMKVPYVANELLWSKEERDPTHLDGYDHQSLEEVFQEAKEFFVGVEEGKDSLPLLYDMDQMPSDSICQLTESCDKMIHQEEEICQLHGVMEFCSEQLTLFDRLGQVQDQLEDF
ncbi:hypothetical protein F5J12DRAFT_786819 [Pisolithus orientalis]|uniref:uncharacterized protein n=1 Tax=Pisolithus orientalis TaxID=936130 RepID=UPI0022241F9A|nr:uncharacterized protein F5J12DRAFT_786819 [Pisolithus orientalis]KAI5988639.1 hypothetical protein F5J12DRAFT_786819 [Pisolithus orientalis]